MPRLSVRTWVHIIACLAALWLLTTMALPHDAGGWAYDSDCCHNRDCAPVQSAVMGWGGEGTTTPALWVRTIHGIGPITPQTSIRESKDSQHHACIREGRVVCYYAKPGG